VRGLASHDPSGLTSSSLVRVDRDEMTQITEVRDVANGAAMNRSTPAASDRPYLTVGAVLRAGIRRAAGRTEMAAAKSTWDSEGGATDQRTTHGKDGTGPLVPQAH
jgi:hypothetical protein